MKKELKEPNKPSSPESKQREKIFISFTDLVGGRQEWLVKLIQEKDVYLTGRKCPPIRLSFAEIQ